MYSVCSKKNVWCRCIVTGHLPMTTENVDWTVIRLQVQLGTGVKERNQSKSVDLWINCACYCRFLHMVTDPTPAIR